MKLLASVFALLVLVGASPQSTATDTSEATAEAAALKWLRLVDGGDYAKSWTTAATLLKNSVTQAQFTSGVAAARKPLGAVKSRSISSATFTKSLPNAPAGEYVVIQFTTNFEHVVNATETVTPMKEPDGEWRVSGYYIR
jgi:Protein of unknown function (DUF4019)